MSTLRADSLRRLRAMEIDVWVPRAAAPAPDDRASVSEGPRIRLEAGGGRWLLVADEDARARFRVLLDDLRALLDPAECRFGKWSDSVEAGVGLDELGAQAIEHVLVFGESSGAGDAVCLLPALEELETSGAARRQAWRLLRPLIGG